MTDTQHPIIIGIDGYPSLPEGYRPTEEHKAFHVPPGWVEMQGYVPAHWIRIDNSERMAVAEVGQKYEAIMGERHWRAGYSISPVPKIYWEVERDGRLVGVLQDGRHRLISSVMFGDRLILLRWNSPDPARHWGSLLAASPGLS